MKRGILCPSSSVFFTQVKTFERASEINWIPFVIFEEKRIEVQRRNVVVAVATILQIIENRLMNFHRVHFHLGCYLSFQMSHF